MLQIYKIIFKCMYYLVKDRLEYTGCFKIREFRIQSVVGKDPVEFEKYFEKKFAFPEEDISTLILFNT
jgi:hypothetical protein